jgi:hypothetical protein
MSARHSRRVVGALRDSCGTARCRVAGGVRSGASARHSRRVVRESRAGRAGSPLGAEGGGAARLGACPLAEEFASPGRALDRPGTAWRPRGCSDVCVVSAARSRSRSALLRPLCSLSPLWAEARPRGRQSENSPASSMSRRERDLVAYISRLPPGDPCRRRRGRLDDRPDPPAVCYRVHDAPQTPKIRLTRPCSGSVSDRDGVQLARTKGVAADGGSGRRSSSCWHTEAVLG